MLENFRDNGDNISELQAKSIKNVYKIHSEYHKR